MKKSAFTLGLLSSALLLGATRTVDAAGGWLGVHPEPPLGVHVSDVIKDSPADKCGLQRGDIIMRLNGQDLMNVSQFSMEIYRLDPGTEVTLSVHRKGEVKEIKTKLDNVTGHSYFIPNLGTPTTTESKSPFSFNRSPLPLKSPGMGSIGPAHSHDYQTRLKSAWSMLEAYERIAEEKKLGEKGKILSQETRSKLNTAQQLFEKYQINEGRVMMEQAYARLQDALIQLRNGETLVLSKTFESPEAEYVYTLGYNNAFQLLLEQELNSKSLRAESSPQIEKARQLRANAEDAAQKKEFSAGIGLLEQSTEIMTELLRQSGLDIP
ncbi:MAG: PDZ domain-containing protein [Magnetococcales bacterium]|nr:PDZ domain-containing protein [Magnetococcales bacterium]